MIVKMSKYYFVLLKEQHESFLNKLKDLGLVDITTTSWEASDTDRALMSSIDKHRACLTELKSLKNEENLDAYSSGTEAYAAYVEAKSLRESTLSEIQRAEREMEELKVWGEFSPEQIAELERSGLTLCFFSAYKKQYLALVEQSGEEYTFVAMNPDEDNVFFVAISTSGNCEGIDAQMIKTPTMSFSDKSKQIEKLKADVEKYDVMLEKCANSTELILAESIALKEELRFSQVKSSAASEADDSLVVMQAWATNESSPEVDAMLEATENLVYLKDRPTPEDDTPVLLKNNKFSRLFEMIGAFYALPRYGTLDITAWFGPFYMIFFGFCLGDAGYGLLFVLAGLYLRLKGSAALKSVGALTLLCGIATVVFGFLTGSFFGIVLPELTMFAPYKSMFITADSTPISTFILAIGIGIFQILVAMCLKLVNITIQNGFRYALAPLGWIIVIISSLVAALAGIEAYSMSSLSYQITAGLGLAMMLLLNNPKKNPLVNIGAGLWNTYNDVTGILGDLLSYIRLFAIGLSGSILAQVFNNLAANMSPDVPVLGTVVTILILLAGHGINLFMSSLSSFVHPLRLTFVEFYKNVGFDSTLRAFTPFKHENK
ncbi:MAG: V-type ATPase 116kDa subunit family protein [Rikenellaceae bacterium]